MGSMIRPPLSSCPRPPLGHEIELKLILLSQSYDQAAIELLPAGHSFSLKLKLIL